MEETTKKPRAPRRTKKELNTLIWEALERLIVTKGFHSINIPDVARESGIEPPVLYGRFTNVENLFAEYAKSKDLWLNETLQLDYSQSIKDNAKRLYAELIDEVFENEIMQQILLWELCDTHPITREIAQKREYSNGFLLAYMNSGIKKDANIDFNTVNSMIISGIYYLAMHKKISTFSTMDFNRNESKEKLKKSIYQIIDSMFE